jgi:sugar phosphate isomerase/epimerase
MKERFKLIKAVGFDGVLLWWNDEYADVDGTKYHHPELARRNGLFIENMHTPIIQNNCLWEDNIKGKDFEEILLDCINDCKRFEIPTAVVHITYGDNPPPYNQIGLDRIKRLVEVAEKKNVNIALENLQRPDYLDFVFANIHSNRLGFCYDSGHENCYTKGTELLSQYGSKLMALHLHDNDGTDDQHLIPGEGSIDWGVVKKKLNETKYSGAIALEVTNEFSHCSEKKNPETFLKRAFESGGRFLADFMSKIDL